jgi:hypothetical protein
MNEKNYPASTSREVQGSLARILYEKNGPSVLPLVSSIFAEFGAIEGKKARKKTGEVDFATAVKTFFAPALESKPPRAEIVSVCGTKLVLKGFKCAMGLQGAGREVCRAVMAIDQAVIENLTGKDVKMDIKQSLAGDDEYCLVEFSVDTGS